MPSTQDPIERFDRASTLVQHLRLPEQGLARVHHAAFTLAIWAHLWLGDAWNLQWLPFNILLALGTLVLWVRSGSWFAWGLCIVGLAGPLLFARDQLTQSVLMLVMSLAMFIGAHRARRPNTSLLWYRATMGSWQGVTIATYLWAGLHKLNRDFLAPQTSCAQYGWDKLIDYWNLGFTLPSALDAWLPWSVIATELGIALGLTLGWRRLVWPLAVAFHIPLTVTMAPAFALVMAAGHVSFLTQEDLTAYTQTLRDHRIALFLCATAGLCLSIGLHGAWPPFHMIPKEWALWGVGAWCVLTLMHHGLDRSTPVPWILWSASVPRRAKALSILGGALVLLNGLTPYLGIQYQHTGAMLSNMRVDHGCWNSYILPESMRLQEEYVRFEQATMGTRGDRADYERTLTSQLWTPPQLRQIQRNWCAEHNRPIRVQGVWRHEAFSFDDLCDAQQVDAHFDAAGVFGVNVFPDFLRFQKNLKRVCPQACIH